MLDEHAVFDAKDVDPFRRQWACRIGSGNNLMSYDDVALGNEMENGRSLGRPACRLKDQLLEPIPSRRDARFVLNVVGRHKLVDRVNVPGGASAIEGVVEVPNQ